MPHVMTINRRPHWWVFAGLLAVALISAFGLAELACHVLGLPRPVVSGWRGTPKPMEVNQLGFRGQTIDYSDSDSVIVLLGDSSVEATACCGYGWMPERRLERYLRTKHGKKVRVFTLGASGYGTDQQLLALREYYGKYRADLVIHWQTPSNDVWNNLFPTHWPANGTRKPTFWIEKGTLQGPSEAIGEVVAPPTFRLGAMLRGKLFPRSLDEEWEEHLPPAYESVAAPNGLVDRSWEELRLKGLLRDESLVTEKSHLAIYLTPPSPRMQYALDLTRLLLLQVEKEVTSRSGSFSVFRPLYQDAQLVTPAETVYEFAGRFYRASRLQRERSMAYVNKGFRLIEVRLALDDQRVGPWDAHLNEHATDEAMDKLADAVASSLPREHSVK